MNWSNKMSSVLTWWGPGRTGGGGSVGHHAMVPHGDAGREACGG